MPDNKNRGVYDYMSEYFEFCPRCGTQIEKNQIICTKCGYNEGRFILKNTASDSIYSSKAGGMFKIKGATSMDGIYEFCPQCRTQIEKNQIICTKCGYNEGKFFYINTQKASFNNSSGVVKEKKYNTFCVTGFSLGIASALLYWLVPFLPILAIITSIIGISKINIKGQKGKAFGISGLGLGILFTIQIIIKLYLDFGL